MVFIVAQIPSVIELIWINKFPTEALDGYLIKNLSLFKRVTLIILSFIKN